MSARAAKSARRLSRSEWLTLVSERRRVGMTGAAVARDLGISQQFVSDLLNDPTGAKLRERRRRYSRPCPKCGKPMNGSDGNGPRAPKMCAGCSTHTQHENRYWTPERIIAAIQGFAAERGRPPSADEWQRHRNGQQRPYVFAVQREFGTWHNGLAAAGFDVPPRGKYVRSEETLARLSTAKLCWTHDLILDAIRAWTAQSGHVPTYREWMEAGTDHPCVSTVLRRFGSLGNAVRAAGLTPRRVGQRLRRPPDGSR